jgi:phosphate transport system substrate-binding protein
VQSVGAEEAAIGYSGIGFATANVRAVPLAKKAGEPFVEAAPANAYNGTYPMWRALYLTVNKNPVKELPPLQREFLKFVLSQEGQAIVVEDGYLPLPARAVTKALDMLK